MKGELRVAASEVVTELDLVDVRAQPLEDSADLATNQPEHFTILGAWDSDPEKDVVSYLSPVAQSLLGHKVGDEVEVEVHGVRHHHRIDSIEPCGGAAVPAPQPPAPPSPAP